MQKKTIEARLLRWRKAFAAVLAQSRRDADLTQLQTAEGMGWTRNTVTKIEAGLRPVTAEELVELCRLFKVEVRTIIVRAMHYNG